MGDINEWLPVIAAGGLGLVLAFFASFRLAKKSSDDDFHSASLADLEERYNHAVALLKDLELYQARMDSESYEEQRGRLEQEAVAAMRARDRKVKLLQKDAS